MGGATNTGFRTVDDLNVEALVNKDTGKLQVEAEIVSDSESSGDIVENLQTEGLLNSILKELKIMNFHLSLITDTCITETEVD